MKKLILSCAIVGMIVAGCKSLPTVEQMTKLGNAAGYTTAYVLNKQVTITNDATRSIIREAVEKTDKYLPATNETCQSKWSPMIKELTDKYVAEGKLTQAQADRVVKDLNSVFGLLDSYIDKKGIRDYTELTNAFIHAFSAKFLANFKQANITATASQVIQEIDSEMFEYLSSKIK